MVIKKINELLQAANVNPTDLFVLQQGNTAKALTGQTLENWLLSLQKVHGTIKDWRIDKTGEFTFNLVLILTDNAEITVPMSNGKDGAPGNDGVSPTAKTTQTATGAIITVTDRNGTTTAELKNGKDGSGGTTDHNALINRDMANQHPVSAITGLQEALNGKQPAGNYLTAEADPTVPAWAKKPQKPTYTAQEVGALPVNTVIPDKTSQLANNSGFITKAVSDLTNYYKKSETYTQAEINQKLSAIPKFAISVVTELPTASISDTTIYLLKSGEESQNLYTEYIHVGNAWEKLGTQTVDLTEYAKKTEIPSKAAQLSIKSTIAQGAEIDMQTWGAAAEDQVARLWDAKQPAGDYALKSDLNGKLDKSGGTITGNVAVDGNFEARHVKGTWLQTTATTTNNALDSLAVIDSQGWVYKMKRSLVDDFKALQEGGYSKTRDVYLNGLKQSVELFDKDASGWTPTAVLDGSAVDWQAEYYWQADGSKVTTQYTKKYFASPKIEISPNCEYEIYGLCGNALIYDSTGSNGVNIVNENVTQISKFNSGSDGHYLAINTTITGAWTPQRLRVTRTTISKEEFDRLPVNAAQLKPLFGKTVVCFGDSLFGMYRGETSAPAYAARESGATAYNVGFGGCWMSDHADNGWIPFSMNRLADAVVTGDFSAQDAAISGKPDYFSGQLNILKGIDFSKVDMAVIHYGTNDWFPNHPAQLDNTSNPLDRSTMCGALRYSIERIQTAYPNVQIYISVPCYRTWTDSSGNVTYSDDKVNRYGLHLWDVGAAFAEVARAYNLTVIDSYHGLNINKKNWANYLEDGTHHNQAGRKRFGTYIGQCLTAGTNSFGFCGSGSGEGGVSETRVNELIAAAIGNAMKGAY